MKYNSNSHAVTIKKICKILFENKSQIIFLFIAILFANALQAIIPFLTQSVVDKGIKNNNLTLIQLILLGQLIAFIGQAVANFYRNRLFVQISNKFNIKIIQIFINKLLKVTIDLFEKISIGNLIQRIYDVKRIESFFTNSSLNIIFSFFTFLMYSVILLNYDFRIFLVFIVSSCVSVVWFSIHLKRRREMDSLLFSKNSKNYSNILHIIKGIRDIRLNNAETQKLSEWYQDQKALNQVQINRTGINQIQLIGSNLISQLKDILIIYIVSQEVINGNLTMGTMLAITYIVGQLNSPLIMLPTFIQSFQDTKLSISRINEIQEVNDEDVSTNKNLKLADSIDIDFIDISFRYQNSQHFALKNINLRIKSGKTIAIVGKSGSGKSTLIKLLLKFYKPTSGKILIGKNELEHFNPSVWRNYCGVVLQDNYLFPGSITNNIALGDPNPDRDRLMFAAKLANVTEFIENSSFDNINIVTEDVSGISEGQKQRIMIARAIFKNPRFLFFDEATSSLDINNERNIINNVQNYLKDSTKIIITHHLSNILVVDEIIVLEKGMIIERGTHEELLQLNGYYHSLFYNEIKTNY